MPGDRPTGYSHGVLLNLIEPDRLEITVKPCKSHGGRYGTESTTITVDPTIAEAPAKFLAQCCHEAGSRLVVSVASKNAVRKAIGVLGEKAFGKGSETITPSVLRHQIIADLKVIFGGGEKVAAASGQLTDRTQSKYGFHQHGRNRKGYVAISSARIPRTGNVARVNELSKSKVPHPETCESVARTTIAFGKDHRAGRDRLAAGANHSCVRYRRTVGLTRLSISSGSPIDEVWASGKYATHYSCVGAMLRHASRTVPAG